MYIDSTRYLIYENTERYPPFVEVLFDSVGVEKDENGQYPTTKIREIQVLDKRKGEAQY